MKQYDILINIASGKGGTGKTLFAAILADMLGNRNVPVLVIDMDIFVRGLTSLLYFHKEEAIHITKQNELSIFDFIKNRKNTGFLKNHNFGIYRYRSFDILPSVPRIDISLKFDKILPENEEEYSLLLKSIIERIPTNQYKYIIIDSRAGYDDFIVATHKICDLTICIQEDDDISDITAENLKRQLEQDSDKPILRIINKARDIKQVEDLDKLDKIGVSYLGKIPFDKDVMDSFGKPTFWDDIAKTIYKVGLVKTWNRLAKKMNFKEELIPSRISPFASNRFESLLGFMGLRERIIFIYGIIMTIMGIGYTIYGSDIVYILRKNPLQLISFIVGIIGILFVILSVLSRRK